MKKIFCFILAAITAVSMTACANNETPSADISVSGGLSVESLSKNLTTDILDSIYLLAADLLEIADLSERLKLFLRF